MTLRKPLGRAGAALIAMTTMAWGRGEEPGVGSDPVPEPSWITGTQVLSSVDESGGLEEFATLLAVPDPEKTDEVLIVADGVLLGAVHDPSDDLAHYTFTALDGTSASLDHDVDLDGYTLTLGGQPFVLDGRLDPVGSSGPGDPKVKVFRVTMRRADGTTYDRGLRFRYYAPSGSTQTASFMQFFTLLAEYGGDGWSEPLLPDDPLIKGTGNGGEPRNSDTGKGFVKGDGSTVYVDGKGTNPEYASSSKGGVHTTSDYPGEDGDREAGRVGSLGQARENESDGEGREVKWVRFTHELTMYLLLDDEVVWRFDWKWVVTYDYPTLIGATPTSRSGGLKAGGSRAASELDAKHAEALQKFESGDYSGAAL